MKNMNVNCGVNSQNEAIYQCKKIDLDKSIFKIQELINGSVSSINHSRICTLLYDFLHESGERGFFFKHLTAIVDILEFLAWRAKDVNYQIHLDRMLELCCQPLQLERFSECFSCTEVIEQYFTILGCLLMILPNEEQTLRVYRALSRLLFQSKSVIQLTVPLEIYHQAMEKSQLPIILARLLQISPSDMYKRVLDLIFILVSVSSLCCKILLQAGALEHLLYRLHPSYKSGFTSVPPIENSDLNLDKEDYYEEMILATNIIWGLIRVALPLGKMIPSVDTFPMLSRDAMWSFRCAFRREVFRSKRCIKSILMRNDLTCLILAGIVSLPFWKLIKSGLADDIAVLVAIEIQSENTWASNIKLNSSNEDLLFKKMLLLIISHLTESDNAVKIMIDRQVFPAVLQLINPEIHSHNISWSSSQFLYLSQYAMSTLTYLAPKMPDEFIKYKGASRLIIMLEWSMTVEFQMTIVMNLVKTICSIITLNCPMMLEDFREQGIVVSVTKLVHKILNNDSLTTQHQRLLTFLIIIMQEAINNNIHLQKICGDESVKLILHLLHRCFHQKKGDFLFDQRILVSIGSFIWQCVVKCPLNLEKFIKIGAIYLLLDVIEGASFFVRCIYLGLLSDMCQATFCGAHLCTWRGIKTKGFMSLLAETWREEEKRIAVKRTREGCIEDLELPLMGEDQKYTTYQCKQLHDSSPALVDMVGSVRSKIYGIINMMDEEADKYEKTKEHYKILMEDIPTEDLVTLCIIVKYYQLKEGQVWIEVSRFLQENEVQSLEMDREVISVMIEQHRRCAMDIKEKQEKILRESQRKEKVKEIKRFSTIRDSTLASALTALREIDFIRKTTENNYKKKQEYQRMQFIECSLNFPPDADEKNCHRMNRNFMNIRQNHSIHDPEMQYLKTDHLNDILPVSSSNSEDHSFINSTILLMNNNSEPFLGSLST